MPKLDNEPSMSDVGHLGHMRRHFSRVAKQYRKTAQACTDAGEREIALGCVKNCKRIANEYRALIANAEVLQKSHAK